MSRFPRATAFAVGCLAAAIATSSNAQISPATLIQADQALQAGEADKALALLVPLPQSGQGAAQAQNLLCRVRFTLTQWDQAVHACESAALLDPNNSNDHMWLGRALGEKADHASFLTAYSLGKHVRSEFEEAVRLDPRNAAALFDLGEFYRAAPGIVGGGTDKASAIAAQLDKADPAQAHHLRGMIAESNRDYASAEHEIRQAIAISPHPASQWVNLAEFYIRRRRWAEMETAIRNCAGAAARDPHASVALYDGAGLLIATSRNPAMAAKMLEDYLAGSSKTEEAPAFIARIRLGRLKQQLGDAAGAQREFAAASAMAREYNPAQDSRY